MKQVVKVGVKSQSDKYLRMEGVGGSPRLAHFLHHRRQVNCNGGCSLVLTYYFHHLHYNAQNC
jgi:hypothetical protein